MVKTPGLEESRAYIKISKREIKITAHVTVRHFDDNNQQNEEKCTETALKPLSNTTHGNNACGRSSL